MTTKLTFGLNLSEKAETEFLQEKSLTAQNDFLSQTPYPTSTDEYILTVDEARLQSDATYRQNFATLWSELNDFDSEGVLVGLDATELASKARLDSLFAQPLQAGMGPVGLLPLLVLVVNKFIRTGRKDAGETSWKGILSLQTNAQLALPFQIRLHVNSNDLSLPPQIIPGKTYVEFLTPQGQVMEHAPDLGALSAEVTNDTISLIWGSGLAIEIPYTVESVSKKVSPNFAATNVQVSPSLLSILAPSVVSLPNSVGTRDVVENKRPLHPTLTPEGVMVCQAKIVSLDGEIEIEVVVEPAGLIRATRVVAGAEDIESTNLLLRARGANFEILSPDGVSILARLVADPTASGAFSLSYDVTQWYDATPDILSNAVAVDDGVDINSEDALVTNENPVVDERDDDLVFTGETNSEELLIVCDADPADETQGLVVDDAPLVERAAVPLVAAPGLSGIVAPELVMSLTNTSFVKPNGKPSFYIVTMILEDHRRVEFAVQDKGKEFVVVENSAQLLLGENHLADAVSVQKKAGTDSVFTIQIGENQAELTIDRTETNGTRFTARADSSKIPLANSQEAITAPQVLHPSFFEVNRHLQATLYLDDGRELSLVVDRDDPNYAKVKSATAKLSGYESKIEIETTGINGGQKMVLHVTGKGLDLDVVIQYTDKMQSRGTKGHYTAQSVSVTARKIPPAAPKKQVVIVQASWHTTSPYRYRLPDGKILVVDPTGLAVSPEVLWRHLTGTLTDTELNDHIDDLPKREGLQVVCLSDDGAVTSATLIKDILTYDIRLVDDDGNVFDFIAKQTAATGPDIMLTSIPVRDNAHGIVSLLIGDADTISSLDDVGLLIGSQPQGQDPVDFMAEVQVHAAGGEKTVSGTLVWNLDFEVWTFIADDKSFAVEVTWDPVARAVTMQDLATGISVTTRPATPAEPTSHADEPVVDDEHLTDDRVHDVISDDGAAFESLDGVDESLEPLAEVAAAPETVLVTVTQRTVAKEGHHTKINIALDDGRTLVITLKDDKILRNRSGVLAEKTVSAAHLVSADQTQSVDLNFSETATNGVRTYVLSDVHTNQPVAEILVHFNKGGINITSATVSLPKTKNSAPVVVDQMQAPVPMSPEPVELVVQPKTEVAVEPVIEPAAPAPEVQEPPAIVHQPVAPIATPPASPPTVGPEPVTVVFQSVGKIRNVQCVNLRLSDGRVIVLTLKKDNDLGRKTLTSETVSTAKLFSETISGENLQIVETKTTTGRTYVVSNGGQVLVTVDVVFTGVKVSIRAVRVPAAQPVVAPAAMQPPVKIIEPVSAVPPPLESVAAPTNVATVVGQSSEPVLCEVGINMESGRLGGPYEGSLTFAYRFRPDGTVEFLFDQFEADVDSGTKRLPAQILADGRIRITTLENQTVVWTLDVANGKVKASLAPVSGVAVVRSILPVVARPVVEQSPKPADVVLVADPDADLMAALEPTETTTGLKSHAVVSVTSGYTGGPFTYEGYNLSYKLPKFDSRTGWTFRALSNPEVIQLTDAQGNPVEYTVAITQNKKPWGDLVYEAEITPKGQTKISFRFSIKGSEVVGGRYAQFSCIGVKQKANSPVVAVTAEADGQSTPASGHTKSKPATAAKPAVPATKPAIPPVGEPAPSAKAESRRIPLESFNPEEWEAFGRQTLPDGTEVDFYVRDVANPTPQGAEEIALAFERALLMGRGNTKSFPTLEFVAIPTPASEASTVIVFTVSFDVQRIPQWSIESAEGRLAININRDRRIVSLKSTDYGEEGTISFRRLLTLGGEKSFETLGLFDDPTQVDPEDADSLRDAGITDGSSEAVVERVQPLAAEPVPVVVVSEPDTHSVVAPQPDVAPLVPVADVSVQPVAVTDVPEIAPTAEHPVKASGTLPSFRPHVRGDVGGRRTPHHSSSDGYGSDLPKDTDSFWDPAAADRIHSERVRRPSLEVPVAPADIALVTPDVATVDVAPVAQYDGVSPIQLDVSAPETPFAAPPVTPVDVTSEVPVAPVSAAPVSKAARHVRVVEDAIAQSRSALMKSAADLDEAAFARAIEAFQSAEAASPSRDLFNAKRKLSALYRTQISTASIQALAKPTPIAPVERSAPAVPVIEAPLVTAVDVPDAVIFALPEEVATAPTVETVVAVLPDPAVIEAPPVEVAPAAEVPKLKMMLWIARMVGSTTEPTAFKAALRQIALDAKPDPTTGVAKLSPEAAQALRACWHAWRISFAEAPTNLAAQQWAAFLAANLEDTDSCADLWSLIPENLRAASLTRDIHLQFIADHLDLDGFTRFLALVPDFDLALANEVVNCDALNEIDLTTAYRTLENLHRNGFTSPEQRAGVIDFAVANDATPAVMQERLQFVLDTPDVDLALAKEVVVLPHEDGCSFAESYRLHANLQKMGFSAPERATLLKTLHTAAAPEVQAERRALLSEISQTTYGAEEQDAIAGLLRALASDPVELEGNLAVLRELHGESKAAATGGKLYSMAGIISMMDPATVQNVHQVIWRILSGLGHGESLVGILQIIGESADVPKMATIAALFAYAGRDVNATKFWQAVQFTWPKIDFSKVPVQVKSFGVGMGVGLPLGVMFSLVTSYILQLVEGETDIDFATSVEHTAQLPGMFTSNYLAEKFTFRVLPKAMPKAPTFLSSAEGFVKMGPGFVAGMDLAEVGFEILGVKTEEHPYATAATTVVAAIAGGMSWNALMAFAATKGPYAAGLARYANPIGLTTMTVQYGLPLVMDFKTHADAVEGVNRTQANFFVQRMMMPKVRANYATTAQHDYADIFKWLRDKDMESGGIPTMALTRYGEFAYAYAKATQKIREARKNNDIKLEQACQQWLEQVLIPELIAMIAEPSLFASPNDRVVFAVLFTLTFMDSLTPEMLAALKYAVAQVPGGEEIADEFLQFLTSDACE